MKTLLSSMFLVVALIVTAGPNAYGLKGPGIFKTINKAPEVVSTLSDRDAIPMAFRDEMMYCYVADNHKIYQLRGGITNANWVELDVASTLKIQGPAGSLPYIDATGLLATDLKYKGKSKYDFSGGNSLGQGQYINANGVGNSINNKSHNNINGYNSYSDGDYVTIMGERDTVLGANGNAFGNDITLKGNNQFGAGLGLVAQSIGEAVFGQFNTLYTSSGNTWNANDRVFTVGNGTGPTNRSDAMIIYKNGDAVFNGNVTANNLYSKTQVDSLVINSGGSGGVVQSLSLNSNQLTITGSNTITFSNWDTDVTDDFSGDYNALTNKPVLFSGNYNDLTNAPNFTNWDTDVTDDFSGDYNALTNKPILFSGDYNDLTNAPNFTNWDTDVTDDFSGDYNDLTNAPNFTNWDTDVTDDFSGDFSDLNNIPNLYTRPQVDSAISANLSSGTPQNLNLLNNQLTITGGNSVNFTNWDTDVTDDFSGDYNDLANAPDFTGWDTDASDDFSGDYNALTNKPTLFSGDYSDLTNAPNFTNWDTDVTDDFSGDYNDLINVPNFGGWDTDVTDDFTGNYNDLTNVPALYNKLQVDSAISANMASGSVTQNLSLSGTQLSITGGNSINFSNWDTDVTDDFSGDYNDLVNAPDFTGWDTDASDDFDGVFSSLTNIPNDFQDGKIEWNEIDKMPALYQKYQVDSIRDHIIDSMKTYVDSAVISQAHSELVSSRALQIADIGKTIYVKGSTSVLMIPANAGIPFNRHVELRDFGSGQLILDASNVILRDEYGNVISSGTGAIIIHDAAITSIGSNEFKIIGLYE